MTPIIRNKSLGLIKRGLKPRGMAPRGSKRPLQRSKGIKPKKIPKGLEPWIRAIPVSKLAHGSGHLQKRLWRLKSDFVRIRDWTAFGSFIDTGKPIKDWNDSQAGHYRSYAECRGMFKFHEMNIHAQSPNGNAWPTSSTWENYKKNLIARYNQEFFDAIDASNKNWEIRITTDMVLQEMERTIKMIAMLPEQPPYFARVMKLRAQTPLKEITHYKTLLEKESSAQK